MRDPYEVLGLNESASDAEVRAAYRQLTRRWHPDRFVGAPPEEQAAAAARFAEVTGAWQLLNDAAAMARWRGVQKRRAGNASPPATPPRRPARPPEPEPEGTRPRPDPRPAEEGVRYRDAAASEFYRRPADASRGPGYGYTARGGVPKRPPPPPPSRSTPSAGRPESAESVQRDRWDGVKLLASAILVVLVVPLVTVGIIKLVEHDRANAAVPGAPRTSFAANGASSATLVPGQCFDTTTTHEEDGSRVRSVMALPCSVAHESEAIAILDVRDAFGDDYPGRTAIVDRAQPHCRDAYPGAVGVPFGPGMPLALRFIFPSEESWANGDRRVICAVASPDGAPLTGTARQIAGA